MQLHMFHASAQWDWPQQFPETLVVLTPWIVDLRQRATVRIPYYICYVTGL